jgi:D-alanine-D-alanine ligase
MIDPPYPGESEKLVELAQATGFFDAEEIQTVREMLATYFKAPDSGEYLWLVYREAPGARPLGFACYGPASFTDGTYDLYWIVVAPEHQSRKIGSALIQHVEEDLRKRQARHLYLETSDREQYKPTRAFYERRGYERAAHFPDYYHVGDGKVVYRKVFKE